MRWGSINKLKKIRETHELIAAEIYTEPLSEEEQKIKIACEEDFHTFAKHAWFWVEGGLEFHDGWHVKAITEHLELTVTGEIRDLIINQPPRTMKSTLLAVMFPAWLWTKRPSTKFVYASYEQEVAIADSVKCRRLIESPWYQKLWGKTFRLLGDSNTKRRFDNSQMGYRIATSVGGRGTGLGGDYLIADDPNSAKHLFSVKKCQEAKDWWDQVMSTRHNNPKTGIKIVNQQRLSNDLTEHILNQNIPNLVHLRIPMEFEENYRCVTVPLKSTKGKNWFDPRKKEGELLWPSHMGKEEVEKLKLFLGSPYLISSQLQQRVVPQEGGMFKKHWFNWWTEESPPNCKFIIQSWDTALSELSTGAYSACTTWGVFDNENNVPNIILLNMWRGRVQYPELREMAQRLSRNYYDDDLENPIRGGNCPPDVVLVEAKANGLSLIQDLGRAGVLASRFDPTRQGSKEERAALVSPLVECGRVWLPARPPEYKSLRGFAKLFLELAAQFPANPDSRDVIDSMAQAFMRLKDSGWVTHVDDYVPPPTVNYRRFAQKTPRNF